MPPEHARIDVAALKSQISRRLGPDRSRTYFNSLSLLLAQKLSKKDFERFCISTLGQEIISLHNQLILAILKNASLAKSPPSTPKSTTSPAWDLKRPLSAPLGIPFCHASVGGARKSLPLFTAGGFNCNYGCGELCHAQELRKRMERIAEAHGLGGVTMECTDLLNNGIDAYLKRLIKSCVELVGMRPKGKHSNNGVSSGSSNFLQHSDGCQEALNMQKGTKLVSLDDFKVAMQLNPQQLGEDWPLLLDKLSICSNDKLSGFRN